MQKKYLAIILLVTCVCLNIIFAGALVQKSSDLAGDGQKNTPTVRMVYSFPTKTAPINETPEKLQITSVECNYTSDTFLVTILNQGSTEATITEVQVDGSQANIEDNIVIPSDMCGELLVSFNNEIVPMKTYEIQVFSIAGDSAFFYKVCC